jgi:putative FmdB family regulatory protein
MPLYLYECDNCKHPVELLQKYTDAPPDVCLECGAAECMKRIIGRPNFELKGGGWAKDLYATPPKTP